MIIVIGPSLLLTKSSFELIGEWAIAAIEDEHERKTATNGGLDRLRFGVTKLSVLLSNRYFRWNIKWYGSDYEQKTDGIFSKSEQKIVPPLEFVFQHDSLWRLLLT